MRKVMVSAAAVLVAATACSSGSSGGKNSAAKGPDLSSESCSTIIPDVEKLTAQDKVQIIDITRPKLVADHRKEYAAGTYHPNNKPQVEILSCTGLASWSDQGDQKITYGLLVNSRGELFARFNAV
jgi:hypothetical protein